MKTLKPIFGMQLVRKSAALSILGGFTALGVMTLLPAKGLTQEPAECYKVTTQDTPYADDRDIPRVETWCYKHLNSPSGATLIYNVDKDGRTVPELSALVEENGAITHTSLLAGESTVHRLPAGYAYNPLPVPLVPPSGAQRVPEPIAPSSLQSSDEVLRVLTTSDVSNEDISVNLEGEHTSSAAEAILPWRGFWWPYKSGRLHAGSNSPLAKFDRFVKARTGKNPGTQAWESSHHAFKGVPWSGHCNGWAAASTLRKQPTAPITDPLSGVTFSVSDMKGIYSERDYCPKMAFFGKRYNGWRGDVRSDIPPALFHNTLTYYIGQLKKPIQMDFDPGVPVENRVASGYKMNIERLEPNKYRVEATLTIHTYDSNLTNDPGVAQSFEKTYKYIIQTDEQGNAVDGKWLSSNPDFLWAAVAPGECSDGGNSGLREKWVEQIGKPIQLPW